MMSYKNMNRMGFYLMVFNFLIVVSAFAQWTQTSGPSGGLIRSVSQNNSILYCGTSQGNVFVSYDKGLNWNVTGNGLKGKAIKTIAFAGNTILAGTEDKGIFVSTDSCKTWVTANSGLDTIRKITKILVVDTVIYTATFGGGTFKSTDYGRNWTAINEGMPDKYVTSLTVRGSKIYLGSYFGGVYVIDNNGNKWSKVNKTRFPFALYSLAVGDSNIFAGTQWGGVYYSINDTVWDNLNTGFPVNPVVSSLVTSGNKLFAGLDDGNIYIFDNINKSWSVLNTGLPANTTINALLVNKDTVIAGTEGSGIIKSNDWGVNWSKINKGLIESYITNLTVNGQNIFTSTWGGGVFLSSNAGNDWTSVNNGLTVNNIFALAYNGGVLFAGTDENGIFASSNNGSIWKQINSGLPAKVSVNAFAINNSNIFAGSYKGVFLSTNKGTTWKEVNTGLLSNPFYSINSLAVSGNYLYAATTGYGIYMSNNAGANWQPVNNGLSDSIVYCLAASGTNIFAGTNSKGILFSNDHGSTWKEVNNGLTSKAISCILINGAYIFAGTPKDGVFMSTDNGLNWIQINQGLKNLNITTLAVCGNNIYAGTSGSGVWSYPINFKLSAGENKSICKGQSITLTASGAATYSWSTGVSGASITVSPTITATYKVTGTTNTNTSTALVVITVNNIPVANAGNDKSIITRMTTTLAATGGISYEWDNGINTDTITVSPTKSTTYSVTVTDVNGCSATDKVKVFVDTIPCNLTVDAGSDQTIKKTSSTNTIVTAKATGGHKYIYQWNSATDTGAVATVYPVDFSTTYIVSVKDERGCTASDNMIIELDTFVCHLTVDAGSNQTIIKGDSATLNAVASEKNNIYSWNNNAGNDSIVSISPSITTTYKVTVMDYINGCTASDYIIVTVKAPNCNLTVDAGENRTIINSTGTKLTAIVSGGTNYIYQWSNNSGTDSSIAVNPTITTTYIVTVMSNGCTAKDSVVVFVDKTGINSIFESLNSLNIFPNPVIESSVITFSLSEENMIDINLVDITGKKVAILLNNKIDKGTYNIDFNKQNLKPGVYFIGMITTRSISINSNTRTKAEIYQKIIIK